MKHGKGEGEESSSLSLPLLLSWLARAGRPLARTAASMRLMEAGLRRSRGRRHHLQTRSPARRHVVLAPPLSPLSGGGGACNREAAETPVSLGSGRRRRRDGDDRRTDERAEGGNGKESRSSRATRARTRPVTPSRSFRSLGARTRSRLLAQ